MIGEISVREETSGYIGRNGRGSQGVLPKVVLRKEVPLGMFLHINSACVRDNS
jgi:hypothetical protein